MTVRGTLNGVRMFNELGESEIRNARMTRLIHKSVRLVSRYG